MIKPFGVLPSGEKADLYTTTSGKITAEITDFGATLVRLYVPDSAGNVADVVLGYDNAFYPRYCGIALETQYYPDAGNHPQWKQPFAPANTPYHSETEYRFL